MPEWKIYKQDMISYVEATLSREAVRAESGALHYYQGPIEMKTPMPSVGSFLKSKFAGEKAFRPVYQGTGTIMFEPSLYEFFILDLEDETYVLDRGAYWASDMSVEVTAKMNKISTSLLGGEGLVQTAVKGSGSVVVRAPGPVQVIDLNSDRLVVDGSFAVARSASLDYSVQTSTRSLMGTLFSGEMIVSVLQGTGRVYLAPVPNQPLMMQDMLNSSISGQFSRMMEMLNKR